MLAPIYRGSLFFSCFEAKFANFGQILTKFHADSKIFAVLFAVPSIQSIRQKLSSCGFLSEHRHLTRVSCLTAPSNGSADYREDG